MNGVMEKEILNIMDTVPEQEDYKGADGLLYCGKCHAPKEAYFADGKKFFGRDRRPALCDCRKKEMERRENEGKSRRHANEVERLKRDCFTDAAMREWTFENDGGRCPQMGKAHFYVEHWETMKAENIGYLLWGSVGTGKSYFASCIANALMEKEIPVRMTNFAAILNDLFTHAEGKNEYISKLSAYPLLILDDFGMERGTEYGLEQVYNVIDSRYRSKKPLIVTTNLTLEQIQRPEDTPYARIYDRLLEMCVPVRFTGGNFRRVTAQQKMEQLRKLMEGRGKLMKEVPIWQKSNLSLEEAAAYSGIGINKLRELTNDKDCRFVLWVGSKRLIKRRLFDQYIEQEYSI